jgi:hypothetical protein
MGATAGMFLTAGSAASSFVAQRSNADALAAQGQYEAQMHEFNADIADMQERDARARGKQNANRVRGAGQTLVGSQRAAAAEAGVAVDDGTAAELTSETMLFSEVEAGRIEADAAREAFGFKVQAFDYRNQGRLARTAGRNAARGARNAAYGTLLTGGAQALDIYYRNK